MHELIQKKEKKMRMLTPTNKSLIDLLLINKCTRNTRMREAKSECNESAEKTRSERSTYSVKNVLETGTGGRG